MKKEPVRLKSTEIAHSSLTDIEQHKIETEKQLTVTDERVAIADTDVKTSKGEKLLLTGTLVILFVGLIQLVDALINIFETSPLLGGVLSTVLGVILLQAGKYVYRFIKHKNKLIKHEQLKSKLAEFDRENSYAAAIPILKNIHSERSGFSVSSFEIFNSKAATCQDDAEVVRLYSSMILKGLDLRAKELLVKHATDSALMVALSPFAAVDMLLVLWKNLQLVEDIARIYGLEHVPFGRYKILRQVLKNMMYVGASEMIVDASFDSLGLSLGSKLSARAAQGIGAGLITLRMGVKAIEYCRPVTSDQNKISMASTRGEIISQVKERLLSLAKKGD